MSKQPRVPSDGDRPTGGDGASGAEQTAVDRLVAADPATGEDVDLAAVRALVDARLADDAPSAAGTDDLAARRAQRWASWPARAAGVAAVALLVGGGGGYAIGASGQTPEPAALPAITLEGGGAGPGGPLRAQAAEDVAGAAPGAGMQGAQDAAVGILPYQSGRAVFTGSGLSTEGGVAEAYALDAPAAYGAQTVAAAAAVLGVEGEPEESEWGWTVGPDDGSAASVSVSLDGLVSLSYWDPAKDPWGCAVVGVEPQAAESDGAEGGDEGGGEDADGGDGDLVVEPMPVEPLPAECAERDLGPAPTGDAASAALRDLMDALGVDTGAYEFVAEEWGDPSFGHVTAHHVLDGRRTGLQWTASLTGAGVQSLNGFTAPLTPLGQYAVVSPAEAVERLSDPRFATGWGGPVAWLEGTDPYARAGATEPGLVHTPTLPGTVAPGADVSWPVDQVTIEDARLGLAHHTTPDGASVLVPTYELIGSDGGIWTVVAVTDEHLDFEG